MQVLDIMQLEFNKLKQQDLPFHVLVKFSGGKDSSYLLYLMKEKYGLTPLAFSVIHPFVGKQALSNMKRVCRKLKVKWQPCFVDKKEFYQYMSYGLKNYQKYNTKYHQADLYGCRLCCSVYNTLAYRKALELNIPCVIDGSDFNQLGFPLFIQGCSVKEELNKDETFFGSYERILQDLQQQKSLKPIYLSVYAKMPDKTFPDYVAPLSIIEYDPEKAKLLLEAKGIIKSNKLFVEKTNCTVRHLFAHLGFKYFNCHPYQEHVLRMADSGRHGFTRDKVSAYFVELKNLLNYLAKNPGLKNKELKQLYANYPVLALRHNCSLPWLKDLQQLHRYAEYLDVKL